MTMVAEPLGLDGVLLLRPKSFADDRGFFLETFRSETYQEMGIPGSFVQDNHSRSKGGVLRGLHYQWPHAQGKLIYVPHGRVYDVAVDLRIDSPTFKRWVGVTLDDTQHAQLWIPPGFGHGFYALSDDADLFYRCTDYYRPDCDVSIAWDDPDIGIDWPIFGRPLLSAKDMNAPRLRDLEQKRLPRKN